MMTDSERLFSFGVIADVQYADADNGRRLNQTRYYRDAETQLRKAVDHWNSSNPSVDFVIQLGDLIDNVNTQTGQGPQALEKMMKHLDVIKCKVYHTVGNHELYNFTKEEIKSKLKFPANGFDDTTCCYSFKPHLEYRFIAVDTHDLGMLGYPDTEPRYIRARELIDSKNPHKDRASWDGLEGVEQRYRFCNGGLGDDQLKWLEGQLMDAKQKNEKVLIYGHIPMMPGTAEFFNLSLNYQETLSTFARFHENISCYLAGHNHEDGCGKDDSGIHHVTFPGVIVTPPETSAFADVHVFRDRLEIQGHGNIPSRTLKL